MASLFQVYPSKILYPFVFSPVPATYPAHLTFIHSIAMMMMMMMMIIIIIIIIIIKNVMSYWRTRMRLHTENKLIETEDIKIQCGIFQGDSLSPPPFFIC